jgi:hypothetical protein
VSLQTFGSEREFGAPDDAVNLSEACSAAKQQAAVAFGGHGFPTSKVAASLIPSVACKNKHAVGSNLIFPHDRPTVPLYEF